MRKEAVTLVLVVFTCARASKIPSTCRLTYTDCPEHSIVKSYESYELRKYAPSTWVKTQAVYTGEMTRLRYTLFMKLYQYIMGDNEERLFLNMTAPVLTMFEPGLPVQASTKVTMQFMLPKKFWGKAPIPTETDISVDNKSEALIYVRSFGGHATNNRSSFEYEALRSALGYDNSYAIIAGYDKPSKELDRHNEIWFYKV